MSDPEAADTMNIGQITAKWASRDPNREAIVDVPTGRRVTFGALDRRVRKLANALAQQKVAKGSRIGVLSKNAIEYFEIYYACARAGYIAQPLNWRLSAPELARILADGEPTVVVSADEFRNERNVMQREVDASLWLEYGDNSDGTYEDFLATANDTEPFASATTGDNDPALILYTGGTTGISKGALHTTRRSSWAC